MTVALAIGTIFRFAMWLAFLSSSAWVAFLLVCRGQRDLRSSARWLAVLCVTLVLQHGLLGVVDAFAGVGLRLLHPWFALPVSLLLAAVGHRRLGGAEAVRALREDIEAASAMVQEVWASWLNRLIIAWGMAAATARALGGLVAPPLTWDTLTYHAVKSAEWVQSGFRIRTLGPDQWRYLTFYPDAAEEPGAWAMAFLKGDLGLPMVGIAQWAGCGFAVYALARALGAERPQAFRAAVLVAFLPALLSEMVTGYADMFVLFAFLSLSFAVVQFFRSPGRGEAMLVGASAGLLACAKLSGMPGACLAVAATLLAPASRPGRPSRPRTLLWTAALALVVAGPHYLRVLVETGSPFYPYAVKLGSWTLGKENSQLRALFAGQLGPGDPGAASGLALLQSLVVPSWSPRSDYMGFGPALLLLVPLACVGLFHPLVGDSGSRRRQRMTVVVTLTAMALLPVVGIMSKTLAGQRALWLPILGRLLLSLPALLAVLGATVRNRVARLYLIAATFVTLSLAWPGGIGPPMQTAIWALVPWIAATLSIALLALVGFGKIPALAAARTWGLPASVAVAALSLVVPLAKVRAEHRYAIYAGGTASPATFIMHTSSRRYGTAWPLWQVVDDGTPHRIAASYGWNGIGDNWFRYPLLGSHLQNRVLYVPITAGKGDIVDYQNAERVRQEADELAWLARLRESRIDLVFLGEPEPPELAFVLRHPESFELVGRGQDGRHALYRFLP